MNTILSDWRTRPAVLSAVASLVGCALASAQTIVVPPHALARELGWSGPIAGFEARFRQQILIPGAQLRAASGKAIHAFAFRRDHRLAKPNAASASVLWVEMSHAARSAARPSPDFADNHGNDRTLVFQGRVRLPASGGVGSTIPWRAPFLARVALASSFAYRTGDLCIQIEGQPIRPPARFVWSVDYEYAASSGDVRAYGQPCGAGAASFSTTADAWGRHVFPGGMLSVITFGRPGTTGALMLGARLPRPVALDALGAPGCVIHVAPELALVRAFPSRAVGGTRSARVWNDVPIPKRVALAGATLHAQGANLESGSAKSNRLGVTTTNALRVTVGPLPPATATATVMSRVAGANEALPATGSVRVARGPAIMLELR